MSITTDFAATEAVNGAARALEGGAPVLLILDKAIAEIEARKKKKLKETHWRAL